MALDFDATKNHYLEHEGTLDAETYPLTISCFFNSDDITGAYALVSIAASLSSSNYFNLGLHGNVGGDPIVARARVSGSSYDAETTAGYSASTWTHGCGVFVDDTDRSSFINGTNEGTNISSATPGSTRDKYGIGRISDASPSLYYNGSLCEVGIWATDLTNAEVISLARGISPLLVRPHSLIAYQPLIRAANEGGSFGPSFTTSGTTVADHQSRIVRPIG